MSNPRITFELATCRRRLDAPQGKPLIVYLVVNVEYWRFHDPMPRSILPPPQGSEATPDVPNFSWVEYGMRCGLPRLIDAICSRGIVATASLNAEVIDVYPQAIAAIQAAGWEVMGHGLYQRSVQAVADEHAFITDTLTKLEAAFGERPRGWLGPGLQETSRTPELLRQARVDYVSDWALDDLPTWLDTAYGWLVALPYTLELNDSVVHAVEHGTSEELTARVMRTVAVFEREMVLGPRVMAIAVHPHIMGVPHRIHSFERLLDWLSSRGDVVFMTGAEICDWFRKADRAV